MNPNLFGRVEIKKKVTYKNYKSRQGLVFIKDGWGATDHIDLWDGSEMRAGDINYFGKAKELWF